jgi:hypothetical protein
MSRTGDAVEIRFDFDLLTPLIENNRGDLHLALFDTSTNYEMLALVHLGPNPARSDVWGDGKVSQFNGFGLMLHDDDPFDRDNNDTTLDSGTIRISNFVVDHSTNEHPPFQIIEVIKGAAGNTVRWEAVNGETYSLWSSFNLKDWSELSNSIMATSEVGEFADTAFAGVQSIYYQVRWDPENQ